MYRQGDVLVVPLPADSKVSGTEVPIEDGRVILAHGEVTGHAHAFRRGATMFRDDGSNGGSGVTLIVDRGGADLVHEEHTTHRVQAGKHEVRQQVVYAAGMVRRVED